MLCGYIVYNKKITKKNKSFFDFRRYVVTSVVTNSK